MIKKQITAGLASSAIVLGTDGFGTRIDENTSHALMDEYLHLGGDTIDTARVYGTAKQGDLSKSELCIGRWLKERGGRDRVILATKCAHPPLGNMGVSRLSAAEMEQDLNESLRSLQTDYIDLLWIHRDDTRLPVSGILDTLNRFVGQGKIRAFGASNWRGARLRQADKYAAATGQRSFCASQIRWSAAAGRPDFTDDPTLVEMDAAEFSYYKESGRAVFAFASQAKGFFQKLHTGGEAALSAKARDRYDSEQNVAVLHLLEQAAGEAGITLSAAVTASLTSNPFFPTCAIVGCTGAAQLADTMTGADAFLPPEALAQIFPYIQV